MASILDRFRETLAGAFQKDGKADRYLARLEALLRAQGQLNLVIVGANDGRINDPTFAFLHAHPGQVRLLAVEPQDDLHPFLRENYSFLPDVTLVCGAVAAGPGLTLYRVRKELWAEFAPPYAAGWPVYRAPTGVTSSERAHVESWIRQWSELDPDAAIEEVKTECAPLRDWMMKSGFGERVDVLQVDAEGADDLVIYECSVPELKPKLILFENKVLPQEREERLHAYLRNAGYILESLGGNVLARKR